MNDEVIFLLRKTTVQVLDAAGRLQGTGFFVAPGLILTAAHVVERFDGEPILIRWKAEQAVPAQSVWAEPPWCPPGIDIYPLPDLAMLHAQAALSYDHPCAMLAERIVGSDGFLADGYGPAETDPDRISPNPVRVDYEGMKPEVGGDLIKCKGSLLDQGMSGAPLLDLSSGYVVGVVKAQRSAELPVGLYAVSVKSLLNRRPDLWATSQLFHQSDQRWRQAIEPASTVRDSRSATTNLLQATLSTVERRTKNLPPLVNRAALHQTVWVRHIGRSSQNRATPRNEGPPDPNPVAERFRWRPLRTIGKTTVVQGLPGYGKSWLLAYHAETIATDSLGALDDRAEPERLRIPLLLDSASLGAMLPDHPHKIEEAEVVTALLACLDLANVPRVAVDDCRIMARRAFQTGRLVLCLDGLDEVPFRFQRRLQRALSIIAATPNALLIATRSSGLALLDKIAFEGRVDIQTLGFTPREASRFIAVWLARNPERRMSLERALEANEPLRDIATVPLLLSFLCRLADMPSRSDRFPTSKSALYHEVVICLLSGRWHRETLDPHGLPEPEQRLRALADSIGVLHDSWRSSGEKVARSELNTQLSRHPEHPYLRAASVARWDAWQRASDAEPTSPPPDPVLWEFTFDGLLVAEESDVAGPTIRVLHPSLRDFLLATYLARMEDKAWHAALERHRWFDPEWQEVFALASSLMPRADLLIRAILDVDNDPWLTQTLFAARCVAESGERISDDVAGEVVHALLDGPELTHASDVRRQHAGFSQLVRARVGPAVTRALEICQQATADQKDQADQKDLYLEAVCSLAEIGDDTGIRHARELLPAEPIARRYRERLITALAATEDQAALDLVLGELNAHGRRGDLDAFLAALKPQSDLLLKSAVRVLKTREFTHAARIAVAAALLECGEDLVTVVRGAARDPTLEWGFRCQLIALLIRAGQTDVTADAMTLVRSPNVRAIDRSHVVEAMIRDGQFSWVTSAAQLLPDANLPWDRRAALAAAVRDTGANGVDLLLQQITSPLPMSITVCHLVALVELRDQRALEFAMSISLDEGVPVWIRGTIVMALLGAEPRLVNIEAAMQVVSDKRLSIQDRLRLSVALARAGVREARDAVRATLDADLADLDLDWPMNSRLLAASGPTGRDALAQIAVDDGYSWGIRTESLLALGATQDQDVRAVLARISLTELPELWRNRLIFGLTAAGNPHFVTELVGFLPTVSAAYDIFHQFMYGPNASLEIFFNSLGPLHAAMSAPPLDSGKLDLNEELLKSCGLTWNSDSELRNLLSWFLEQLEMRVGFRLAWLMLPRQLDEFEAYIKDEDEKGAFDWLNTRFPEYRGFIREEIEALKADIVAERVPLPPIVPDPNARNQALLLSMSTVLATLRELMSYSLTRRWGEFFGFLEANQSTMLTDAAVGLMGLATKLDRGWPLHEAHLFVLHNARERGISETSTLASGEERLRQRLLQLLDEGRLEDVYLGGSFGTLLSEGSAPFHFYAAVGAAGIGMSKFATTLMYESGKRADELQTTHGLATIRDLTPRLGWEPGLAEELSEALRRGHAEAQGKDNPPGAPSG